MEFRFPESSEIEFTLFAYKYSVSQVIHSSLGCMYSLKHQYIYLVVLICVVLLNFVVQPVEDNLVVVVQCDCILIRRLYIWVIGFDTLGIYPGQDVVREVLIGIWSHRAERIVSYQSERFILDHPEEILLANLSHPVDIRFTEELGPVEFRPGLLIVSVCLD